MEVFILKHDKTVIIVRLYREFVDLVTVEGEYTGIMTGKVELTVVAMRMASQVCCRECN